MPQQPDRRPCPGLLWSPEFWRWDAECQLCDDHVPASRVCKQKFVDTLPDATCLALVRMIQNVDSHPKQWPQEEHGCVGVGMHRLNMAVRMAQVAAHHHEHLSGWLLWWCTYCSYSSRVPRPYSSALCGGLLRATNSPMLPLPTG